MSRSSTSRPVSLPSIHELLPEHFCRPLERLSLDESRLARNPTPHTLGKLNVPTRHVPYSVRRSPEAPSRSIPPRTNTSPSPARHTDQHREDDKRHACPYCPRRFNRPSSLAIHLNTHTGAKPYPCPACGRQFSVNSNMRRHYRNHFSNGQRSGTIRTPRLSVQRSMEDLERTPVNAEVNMTPYRYPPLDPPTTLSRSTTPSTQSEPYHSDSDMDSLASSPPMRRRSEHTLQGSFAARSAEWMGPFGGQYSFDRIPRSSRSASFPSPSLRIVTSSTRR